MYAVMFYVILNKRKRLRNIFVSPGLVSRAIRICVRMSGARARKGGSGKNKWTGFLAFAECN